MLRNDGSKSFYESGINLLENIAVECNRLELSENVLGKKTAFLGLLFHFGAVKAPTTVGISL